MLLPTQGKISGKHIHRYSAADLYNPTIYDEKSYKIYEEIIVDILKKKIEEDKIAASKKAREKAKAVIGLSDSEGGVMRL